MKLLTTPKEIREKIRWVLGDQHDERIVIVAFIGANAESYIEGLEGLKVYCWLKIPGTNPAGLRGLLAGAKLFAVDQLHMKLYWSRKRGAVLGSANLSNDALGEGEHRLHELAVYIPPGRINAKDLVARFAVKPIDKFTIDSFEERYNLYRSRNLSRQPQNRTSKRSLTIQDFQDWYKVGGPPWRFFWWTKEANAPQDAVDSVETETGRRYYRKFISSDSRSHYHLGGWVLSFRESRYADETIRPIYLEWIVPEIYSLTNNKGWKDYPHIWFQIGTTPSQVPFSLQDRKFQRALAQTLAYYGNKVDNVVKYGSQPTQRFLQKLRESYQEQSGG